MISWDEAVNLIRDTSKFKHALFVSRVMGKIARKLGENEFEWRLVGLLHDLDYDETKSNRNRHGVVAAKRLEGKLPERCLYAIKTHDYRTGFKPKTRLDKAIIIGDSLVVLTEEIGEKHEELNIELLKAEIEMFSDEKPWIRANILKCEEIELSLSQILQLCIDD